MSPCGLDWGELLRAVDEHEWPFEGDYLMATFDLVVAGDESGIHDDAIACLLVGYIASSRQWQIFTERWDRVLTEFDVLDFHSKEYFGRSNGKRVGHYISITTGDKCAYGDWPEQKAADFIAGLVKVINDGDVHPLGASIDVPAFRGLTYGERRFLTGGWFDGATLKWKTSGAPSKPYFLVYDHCLVEAGNRTKHGKKTLFIFDEQRQYESRALQQFGESTTMMARDRYQGKTIGPPPDRFAGVLFRSRVGAPGLQAADMYAHCWYRYLADPNGMGRERQLVLEALTLKRPGMGTYNAEHLERMLSRLPTDVRAAIRATPEQSKGDV